MENKVLVLKSNAVVDSKGLVETLDNTLNKIMKYDFTKPIESDEDNVALKKILADSRKDWKSINDEKIAFKKAVLEPFDKVDTVLKEYQTKFNEQLDRGAKNTEAYETKKKQDKELNIISYFNELKTLHKLDFLDFNTVGINVTMTVTEKKLKGEVLDFVNRVVSDLKLIDTQTHSERIKVRYITTMNVSQAIQSVLSEIEQEELMSKQKEVLEQELIEEFVGKVQVEKTLTKPIVKEEELKVQFTVTATQSKIIKLKEYMETEGIEYE